MNKKQREKNDRRRPAWRIGQSNLEESYPQRILRRVLHEGNLEDMEPNTLYDATVSAVLRERGKGGAPAPTSGGNLERSGNMRRVAATRSGAADKLGWAGVAEIAKELRRVERRRYAVNAMPGWDSPVGMEIRRRLSYEAEVLEWAMEESEALIGAEGGR